MAIDNQNTQVIGSMSPCCPWSTLSGFFGKRTVNLAIKFKQLKMPRRCQMAKPNSQSLLEDGQDKGTGQRDPVERKHMDPVF